MSRTASLRVLLSLGLSVGSFGSAACGSSTATDTGNPAKPDAGGLDAAQMRAEEGPNDVGLLRDSGSPPQDSGIADSGPPPNDSGLPPPDSGTPHPDTGVVATADAGDSGVIVANDTGVHPDAAAPDAAPTPDATVVADAMPADSLPSFARRAIDDSIMHGQGIQVVDLDHDGSADVLVALSLDDEVRLYKNQGGGAGWTKKVISPASSIVAMDVVAADFDGDGNLDVAAVGLFDRASGGFGTPGQVAWYRNPGSVLGDWTAHPFTGFTVWGARYLDAADINGDGKPDLFVSCTAMADMMGNPHGNGLFWFRNDNSGASWSAAIPVDSALLGATTVLASDINHDGVPDAVAVGQMSDQVAWYENGRASGARNDTPAFTKHVIATLASPFGIALANLDADPALELVVTNTEAGGTGSVAWYDPPADATQPWTRHAIDETFGSGDNSRIFTADFDRDGRIDVAVANQETGEIRIYFHLQDGSWAPMSVITGYTGLTFIAGGDLDGDGRPDLVTSTYDHGPDQLSWWRNAP